MTSTMTSALEGDELERLERVVFGFHEAGRVPEYIRALQRRNIPLGQMLAKLRAYRDAPGLKENRKPVLYAWAREWERIGYKTQRGRCVSKILDLRNSPIRTLDSPFVPVIDFVPMYLMRYAREVGKAGAASEPPLIYLRTGADLEVRMYPYVANAENAPYPVQYEREMEIAGGVNFVGLPLRWDREMRLHLLLDCMERRIALWEKDVPGLLLFDSAHLDTTGRRALHAVLPADVEAGVCRGIMRWLFNRLVAAQNPGLKDKTKEQGHLWRFPYPKGVLRRKVGEELSVLHNALDVAMRPLYRWAGTVGGYNAGKYIHRGALATVRAMDQLLLPNPLADKVAKITNICLLERGYVDARVQAEDYRWLEERLLGYLYYQVQGRGPTDLLPTTVDSESARVVFTDSAGGTIRR